VDYPVFLILSIVHPIPGLMRNTKPGSTKDPAFRPYLIAYRQAEAAFPGPQPSEQASAPWSLSGDREAD